MPCPAQSYEVQIALQALWITYRGKKLAPGHREKVVVNQRLFVRENWV